MNTNQPDFTYIDSLLDKMHAEFQRLSPDVCITRGKHLYWVVSGSGGGDVYWSDYATTPGGKAVLRQISNRVWHVLDLQR